MKYKLRAECSQDVVKFLDNIHSQLSSFNLIKCNILPDVEFEFETELMLDELILTLKDIDNSHVMYQTIKPIKEYTGERDYLFTPLN